MTPAPNRSPAGVIGEVVEPPPPPLIVNAAARALTIGGAQRIATGFATLDGNTRGGLRVGKRVVVGGAPGAGKTTWTLQVLWNSAQLGILVLFLACDEEAEDILIRVGQTIGLKREDLERGDADARKALSAALAATPNFILVDADEDEFTIEQASAELVARRQPGQLSVLAVDSIQTARALGTSAALNNKARADAVMVALKSAGKTDGHLVLATCELNRGGYGSQNPSERVDDLAAFKESGSIEYGASLAMVLRRVKDVPGLVAVSTPKNRMGAEAPFRLQLDFAKATFSEAALPDEAEEQASSTPIQKAKEKIMVVVGKTITPIDSANELTRRAKLGKATVLKAIKELIEDGRLTKKTGFYEAVPSGSGTGPEPGQTVTGSGGSLPVRGEPETGTAARTAKTGSGNRFPKTTPPEPVQTDLADRKTRAAADTKKWNGRT